MRPCKHSTADAPICAACIANRARVAAWSAAHPGRATIRSVRSAKKHKRKRRKSWRAYWHRHPSKVKTYQAARRAALRGATPGEPVDPVRVWLIARGKCWLCGWHIPYPGTPNDDAAEDFTIDHVVPCSQAGEHSYRNTRAAHRGCNSRRGAPEPVTMGAANEVEGPAIGGDFASDIGADTVDSAALTPAPPTTQQGEAA